MRPRHVFEQVGLAVAEIDRSGELSGSPAASMTRSAISWNVSVAIQLSIETEGGNRSPRHTMPGEALVHHVILDLHPHACEALGEYRVALDHAQRRYSREHSHRVL